MNFIKKIELGDFSLKKGPKLATSVRLNKSRISTIILFFMASLGLTLHLMLIIGLGFEFSLQFYSWNFKILCFLIVKTFITLYSY